jgi:hypothetical protein
LPLAPTLLSAGSTSSSTAITEGYPYQPPTGQQCWVFISHAGEQKKLLVDIVREKLKIEYPALKVEEGGVFVDEHWLKGGDAAFKKMYESLRDAFVGESNSAGSWADLVHATTRHQPQNCAATGLHL